MSRFIPIGTMIAAASIAALPVLADEAAQAPANPPASSAPASPEASPQPSTPSQPSTASEPSSSSSPTGVVATTNNPNLAVATIRLESGVRAGKIIGEAVQNEHSDRVGTVDDLVLSPAPESKVTMAVVSVGGFLGMGSKLVAVPWGQLKAEGDHLVLPGATKASLNAAPNFQY